MTQGRTGPRHVAGRSPAADAALCRTAPCRQSELRLRPDAFADYLCRVLGFRLLREFGVEESAAGFNRPMLLLRKCQPQAAG